MNIINNKRIIQKIIIALIVVILFNFAIPVKVHASAIEDGVDTIFQPIMQLIARLGDVVVGIFHRFMLGTNDMYKSVMLDPANPTVTDGYMKVTDEELKSSDAISVNMKEYDGKLFWGTGVSIPNILYCPEYIFANRIALLDVNFVNPGEYEGSNQVDENKNSTINTSLRTTVANWYKGFRNLAIVAMLSILVYIGIRIIIGSTAQDKAKYKERLIDWLVGLCLIFVMHYIMAGIMMFTENITNLLSESIDSNYIIKFNGQANEFADTKGFKTNLMGYIRFEAQRADVGDAATYTIMYVALVVFTLMFTITYLKRVLYMAFFTIISPLVAMTYPIDKIADGKAQGFSMWLKEYCMNAIIQPVHLILYYVLISSAADLAKQNVLYALVALGFLLPAEKFIKKMFRLDRGETTGSLGTFAGGALAMQGLKTLAAAGNGNKSKSSGGGSSKGGDENSKEKIRMNGSSDRKNLDAWKGNETDNEANENAGNARVSKGYDRRLNDEQIDELKSEGIEPGDQEYDQYLANHGYGQDLSDEELGESDENEKIPEPDTSARIDNQINPRTNSENPINSNEDKSKLPKRKRKLAWRATKSGVKNLGRGVKYVAPKVGRVAAKGIGAVAGTTIGIGAAVATGDASKVGTFAAGGLMAGRAIGNNAANLAGKISSGVIKRPKEAVEKISSVGHGMANAYREEMKGIEYAEDKQKELQNKKALKEYMKDKEQIKKAKKMAASVGTNNYKDIQGKMFDYEAAGISDEKLIKAGLKMEKAHEEQYNHDQIINIMQEANKLSDDHIMDDKKRKALDKAFEAKVKGRGKEITNLIGEAKGLGEFMQQVRKEENKK